MPVRYALALGALILSGAAHAANVSDRDSKFLQTESQGATYEISIAKLAVDKGTTPAIKSYAQMIISDHDQLNTELRQLASAKGVDLQAGMTDKQNSDLHRLQDLSGTAFDSAYKQETTRINSDDVREDSQELAATGDGDIRGFVQKLRAADMKHQEAGEKL